MCYYSRTLTGVFGNLGPIHRRPSERHGNTHNGRFWHKQWRSNRVLVLAATWSKKQKINCFFEFLLYSQLSYKWNSLTWEDDSIGKLNRDASPAHGWSRVVLWDWTRINRNVIHHYVYVSELFTRDSHVWTSMRSQHRIIAWSQMRCKINKCHGNLALGKVYRTIQYTYLLQVHTPHLTTLALVTAETERQL